MSGIATESGLECGRQRYGLPADAAITLVGSAAELFTVKRDGDAVVIVPAGPLRQRCLVRPAALFGHARGYPSVNTVMGRLLFTPSATEPQRYTPYTLDAERRFAELLVLAEVSPADDLFTTEARWRNYEAVASRLLSEAGIAWRGLDGEAVADLVEAEPWQEPLEACALHALAQWTHDRGDGVVEIGSYRGQSLAMLARALHDVGSGSTAISVDPHQDQPANFEYTQAAMSRIGQRDRLVQIRAFSDDAHRLLRPGSASLVFIDGDHSRQQVIADYENYRDVVAPGGCMVFHDYGYGPHNGRPDVVPGVRDAIDETIMASPDFRPVLLAHTLIAFVKQA